MPIFATLLISFSFSSLWAQETAPSSVQKLAERFSAPMRTCPEKIWPNYNWQNLNVLFVYPDQINSWLWEASSQQFKSIPTSTLSGSATGGHYDFLEIEGKKTLALNMKFDRPGADIFRLGVHEFFHFHGQAQWKRHASGRGTDYPIQWQPRLYRRMIFDHLKNYNLNLDSQSLAKARYWYGRWSQEFPNELRVATDGYEGSAEFVELMAVAIDEKGCSATQNEIQNKMNALVQQNLGQSVSGELLDLAKEGYEVGALTFFALAQSETKPENWAQRVAKGDSPLSILFESVNPQLDTAPQNLVALFQKTAIQTNQSIGAIVDSDIAAWSDRSFVRVDVPFEWLQSNLYPKYFLRSIELNLFLMPMARAHLYQSPRKGIQLELKENAVKFLNAPGPCKQAAAYLLVHESAIQEVNGLLKIQSPLAKGLLDHTDMTDENQFRYLCQSRL